MARCEKRQWTGSPSSRSYPLLDGVNFCCPEESISDLQPIVLSLREPHTRSHERCSLEICDRLLNGEEHPFAPQTLRERRPLHECQRIRVECREPQLNASL